MNYDEMITFRRRVLIAQGQRIARLEQVRLRAEERKRLADVRRLKVPEIPR